jgi:hypothetical protein
MRRNNPERGLDWLFGILDLQAGDLGIGGSRVAKGVRCQEWHLWRSAAIKDMEGAPERPFTFFPATTLQNVFVRRSGSKRRAILCAFNVDLPFKVRCGTPERSY